MDCTCGAIEVSAMAQHLEPCPLANPSPLTEGEYVVKIGGSYQGLWNIRSIFPKLDGTIRCVAESVRDRDGSGLPGMLHIFSLEVFGRPMDPGEPPILIELGGRTYRLVD